MIVTWSKRALWLPGRRNFVSLATSTCWGSGGSMGEPQETQSPADMSVQAPLAL